MARAPGKGGKAAARQDEPLIEWIVAAVAALLVLALMGFFVVEALTARGGQPDIAIEITAIEPVPTGYAVELLVANNGHATAASLELEGVLITGDYEQTSGTTLDYLAARSWRTATLVFTSRPTPETLQLRVVSYSAP